MNYMKISVIFAAAALALTSFLAPLSAQSSFAAGIVLVLPFENVSNHPEYNWVGESFADSLSALLNKPGLIVVTGDERAVAYQRLRLPLTVIPSRATSIKIARELKASMIVIGTYNVTLAAVPDDKSKPQVGRSIVSMTGEESAVPCNEGRMAGD